MTLGAIATTDRGQHSRRHTRIAEALAASPWRPVAGVLTLWTVAFLAPDAPTRELTAAGASAAAAVVASACAFERARRAHVPRLALMLLSVAAAVWALGVTIDAVARFIDGGAEGFTRLAGGATVVSLSLVIAAFASVPMTGSRARRVRSILDIATIVAAILISVVAVRLHWPDASDSSVFSAAVIHALLALLTVGLAGATSVRAARRWRLPLSLCTLGIVAFAMTTMVVAVRTAVSATEMPLLAGMGWLVGWLLLAVGVSAPVSDRHFVTERSDPGWISAVAVVVTFAVLVAVEATGRTASREPTLMALIFLGFGIVFVRSVAFQIESTSLHRAIRTQADEASERAERYEEALQAAGAGIWEYDVTTDGFWSSRGFDRLLGREHSGPQSIAEFLDSVPEPMRPRVRAAIEHAVSSEGPIELLTVRPGSRGERHFETRGSARRGADGVSTVYAGVAIDVSERRRAEIAVQQQAQRADALAALGRRTLSADGLDTVVWDAIEVVADVLNTQFCRVLLRDSVRGQVRQTAMLGDHRPADGEGDALARRAAALGTTQIRRTCDDSATDHWPSGTSDGVAVAASTPITARAGVWGVIDLRVDVAHELTDVDVSFLKAVAATVAGAVDLDRAQRELRYHALHDQLTGLPNRALLVDRVGQLLKSTAGHDIVAVQVGLDRFGAVNDSFGHAGGDGVLIEIGRRLAKLCPAGGSAGRVSGDEFVLTCSDAGRTDGRTDGRTVDALVDEIRSELARPIIVDATEVIVSASIGVARSELGITPEVLLANAATASNLASRQGGDCSRSFQAGHRAESVDRVRLAAQLRRGLREGEIVPWYQPIVRVSDRRVVCAEALARWDRPGAGIVSPERFIPVAEEAGLIGEIGRAMLAQSLDDLARWIGPIGETPCISVNVATQQLVDGSIVDILQGELERTGVDPARVGLEIIEGEVTDDRAELALQTVRRLKQLGAVKVSVDDFGTGHSSLSRLHTFPVDKVKIDRSFVARIEDDPADRALVRAIIEMARALSLEVVAEGVETEGQLALLAEMGCTYAQGWLFAPALPFADLLTVPFDGSEWRPDNGKLFGELTSE